MVRIVSRLTALTALTALSPVSASSVNIWTPEGYDWSLAVVNDKVPSGLWMNASNVPATTDLSKLSPDHPRTDVGTPHEQIAVLAFLGLAWRVASLVAAGVELYDAIQTCKDAANGDAGAGECIKSVFLSAIAFGAGYSAAKSLGTQAGRTLFPNAFGANNLIDLEMTILHKRGLSEIEAFSQVDHNYMVRHQLRSLSVPGSEPEFIGYADDDHRLARRGFGLHPLVPIYRFEHAVLGSMEMTTRDTLNGTYLTMANAGHPTHLLGRRAFRELKAKAKRQDAYDQETLTSYAFEARFDAAASMADTADISGDAGTLYNTFDASVGCIIGSGVPDGSVMDVQMYDQTNEETFGFASLGVYGDDSDADSIEQVTPTGMPLPQCTS